MDFPKSDASSRLHNNRFTDGDPSQGIPPSVDKAAHMNAVYYEVINFLVSVGLTPQESDLGQLAEAVSIAAPWSQVTFHFVDLNDPDPVPGWVICDGNNGRPNMTDRYLYMSDNPGAIDGTNTSSTANGRVSVGGASLSEAQGAVHTHGMDGYFSGSGDTEGSSGRYNDGGETLPQDSKIRDSAGGGFHFHSATVTVQPRYYALAPFMRADYVAYVNANGGF